MRGLLSVKIFVLGLTVSWFAACGLPSAPAQQTIAQQQTPPLSKTQLKRSLSAALREEALARPPEQLNDAGTPQHQYSESVLRLCDLYAQIRGDQRYVDSEMLQKLSFTLRHRLLQIAHHPEAELQRRGVELIQQTIAPGFWDTTGGPGTIYYYALKRALVIRATSEVHADLGNTLWQLRRN